MIKAFDRNKLLKDSRNWCLVQERHLMAGSASNDGALIFQVRTMRICLGWTTMTWILHTLASVSGFDSL